MSKSIDAIQNPTLLRSPPSTQITTCNVHACSSSSSIVDTECINKRWMGRQKTVELSRTQHKLMLQRQSFLADDKNYLDHPDNMRRLTKELDRVNREYKYLKQYQDPFVLSLKRVMQQIESPPSLFMSPISSASSSPSSSSFLSIPPRLQRRGSSQTMHEHSIHMKEERRHSFSFLVPERSTSPGFIGRVFGPTMHHPPPQLKRLPHLY